MKDQFRTLKEKPLQAKDFMTKNIVTCTVDQTVAEAAKAMVAGRFSVIPVVDENGKLAGIVTESSFIGKEVEVPRATVRLKEIFGELIFDGNVESVFKAAQKKTLREVMIINPPTVTPETGLNAIVSKMAHQNIKKLPVTEDGKVVGMITRKDIIKAFTMLPSS